MADLETAGGPRPPKGLDPLVRYMIFHWVLGALGAPLR